MTRADENFLEESIRLMLTGLDYGAYRTAERRRADDLAVRGCAASGVRDAHDALARGLAAWRATHLPDPTRERPWPDAEVLRAREALLARIADVATSLQLAPGPNVASRTADDAAVVESLQRGDHELLASMRALRDRAGDARFTDATVRAGEIEDAVGRIENAMRSRADRLRRLH